MADDIPLTQKSVIVESREVRDHGWNEQTFFPFQEDQERQHVTVDRHAASFPTLGIGALIGALALVALSGVFLLVVQGPAKVVSDWTVHVHKTHRYVTIPKPAAWLSGILSGISVCFHIALSEGLNVSWWYHVRQEKANMRDLHNIWGHGTSTWTAVTSGARDLKSGIVGLSKRATKQDAQKQLSSQRKSFSYVALATLFVATIPLNGFLLQNAVVVKLMPATTNSTIKIPMLNGDNFGSVQQVQAKGGLTGGGVTGWSPMLGTLSETVTSKIAATIDLGLFNTTCLGSCRTTVRGMGFHVQCTDSVQPYDIPVNSFNSSDPALQGMIVNGTDLASVSVTYDYLNANRITLRSSWKNNAACAGEYAVRTCNLDLATVEYPVVINSGLKAVTAQGTLRNTTTMNLRMNLLEEMPRVVSMATSEAVANTIDSTTPVAGLAGLFAQTLNSSIVLSYDFSQHSYDGTSYNALGLFAQQQLAINTTAVYNAYPACQGTVGNISQQALAVIQSMTFQMGAYNWLTSYGSADPMNVVSYTTGQTLADVLAENTPQPTAVQSYQRNEYKVVWAWYFGAMTVTLCVSIFILPTFWGYWLLERKTTMSPFETARAFHAPVLYQEDSTILSKDLIERVGDVQIHRDLPVVPSTPLGPDTGGRGAVPG